MPLLTGVAEVELAAEMEVGMAADAQLADPSDLDPATVEELEALAWAGRLARRRLIEANLRLVVSIARRYLNRGMAPADLMQEGNLGLMWATEKPS